MYGRGSRGILPSRAITIGLHARVILTKLTYPFHPAHARCGDLSSCGFADLRTASLPAFHPAETYMSCLT